MNIIKIIKVFIIFIVTLLVVVLVSFKPVEDKLKTDVEEILDLPNMSDLVNDEIKRIEHEVHIKKLKELEKQKHEAHIKKLEDEIRQKKVQAEELEKQKHEEGKKKAASKGVNTEVFTATAYDLSVASCGKSESHPAYGITANGTSLKGHTLESARAIAVDPKVIKLGSTVYVEFLDEEYKHLTGEFQAVDTGGAIKGSKIDVFFGSGDVAEEVKQFGRRKVKIKVINK